MPEAVHATASTEIAVRMLFKPRKATCEHRNAGGLEQPYRAGRELLQRSTAVTAIAKWWPQKKIKIYAINCRVQLGSMLVALQKGR